jgi:general secretion pathway protein J
MTKSATARGFTVIEMIIALAIIGLISLLLFSGLRLGSRSWEAVEQVSGRISDLRLVDAFLTRALRQARAVQRVFDGSTVLMFGGDAERIEFTAPLSEHLGVSGLYLLRLALEDSGQGSALVMTRWSLHPEVLEGGDGFPAWEPIKDQSATAFSGYPAEMDAAGGAFGRTLLLADVDRFEIAYYGQPDAETEAAWHDEWLDQERLPTLVRLRLATKTQSWPDLVVTLSVRP